MDSIEKAFPLLCQGALRWIPRALISNILENAAGHKGRSKSVDDTESAKRKGKNGESNHSIEESTLKRRRPARIATAGDEISSGE